MLEGESLAITMRPSDTLVDEPGLYEIVDPFFDYTYGTRNPVTHRVHVGVDGFTIFPSDPFDGGDDLGVHHEDTRTYRPSNLWTLQQHLSVFGTEDPEAPGAPWPGWLKLEGGTTEVDLTLPCAGCPPPPPRPTLDVAIDGTGVEPGTHEGWIVFSSDDSGSPAFKITSQVYFDHCREIFEDPGLPDPETVVLEPGDDPYERMVDVSPTWGTIINDVDVIADLDALPTVFDLDWQISLEAPNGLIVFLKTQDPMDPYRDVWDEDTGRGASGNLDPFDTLDSDGLWTLRIENLPSSPANLEFDMKRFHVRLHHAAAPPCL